MTIFYINPMSYNNSAIYDYSLLSNIDKSDAEITFWCSSLYNSDVISDVKFKKVFRYNKLNSKLLKLISYVSSLIYILFYVAVKKPHVIHIQWIRVPKIDRLFALVCKFFRSNIVYTAHNVTPHNNCSDSVAHNYKKYYEAVNSIIVHSENTKEEITSNFSIQRSKINVIRHGLVTIPYKSSNVDVIRKHLIEDYNLEGKIVFASLGVQSPYKGGESLMCAWRELNERECVRAQLILAGKFEDIDYSGINNLNNVTIIDRFISDDEYMAITLLSDVIVLPYVKISQSGVLLSALNERKPILVSHVGGLYEPLSVANVGWDIGEPSKDNVLKCLKHIILNPDEIYNRQNNVCGWNDIHEYYSWNNIAGITLKLYKFVTNDCKK